MSSTSGWEHSACTIDHPVARSVSYLLWGEPGRAHGGVCGGIVGFQNGSRDVENSTLGGNAESDPLTFQWPGALATCYGVNLAGRIVGLR
jgi:hypothetical protein